LLSVATMATPQASCSLAGLYNPTAFGVEEKSLFISKLNGRSR